MHEYMCMVPWKIGKDIEIDALLVSFSIDWGGYAWFGQDESQPWNFSINVTGWNATYVM